MRRPCRTEGRPSFTFHSTQLEYRLLNELSVNSREACSVKTGHLDLRYTRLCKDAGQSPARHLVGWQAMVADFSGDPYDTDKVVVACSTVVSNKLITCSCDFSGF